MKKRILALVMSLAMATTLLAGCGDKAADSSGSSSGTSSGSTSASTSTSTDKQKTYTLKFGHDNNTDGSYHAGALEFARLVEERTDGQVIIEVFPSAQLGDEAALLEGVRMGTVDFAPCGCSNAATVFPMLGLFSVSYLFRDQEHFDACVADDSDMVARVKELVAAEDSGAKIGGIFTIGKRSVINSKHPVVTPEDMEGIKLRVMASPIETQVWSTMGSLPTSIATSETYSALQTGVVDGAENAPIIVYSWKFHEVAPYYSMTEHQFFISPVFVSDKLEDKLPADLYETVMECLADACVYERTEDININEQALKDLAAGGCIINDDVDKEAFMEILSPLQDEVAGQYGVEDVLKMIRDKL